MSNGEIPWPAPGKYDPSGFNRNPAGVFPAPPPQELGPGNYFGPQTPLTFVAGTGNVLFTASWRSPIFDLRPDLRQTGIANPRRDTGATPVWRVGSGAGGQIFVQIMGIDGSLATPPNAETLTGLSVTAIEEAHVSDMNQLATVTTEEDITAAYFTAGKSSALVAAMPPGSGFPIRYWRYTLRFDIRLVNAALPVMNVCSAFY